MIPTWLLQGGKLNTQRNITNTTLYPVNRNIMLGQGHRLWCYLLFLNSCVITVRFCSWAECEFRGNEGRGRVSLLLRDMLIQRCSVGISFMCALMCLWPFCTRPPPVKPDDDSDRGVNFSPHHVHSDSTTNSMFWLFGLALVGLWPWVVSRKKSSNLWNL